MIAVPIELSQANAYVEQLHRHHSPVHRDKFRVACADDAGIHGVIQVARPVSRNMDDGKTLEVVRCCTDGTRNACSFLYSRAARIARELGYRRIITYILESEDGASLRASGWMLDTRDAGGGTWDRKTRPREVEDAQLSMFENREKYPTCKKQRWVRSWEV